MPLSMHWLRAVFWIIAMVLVRPAFAQPDARLSVSRGPGADDCPDAEGLLARIGRIRGASSENLPAEPVYRVAFARDAQGVRAEIASGESARILHDGSPDCAGLAQATAVTLALLFDAAVHASTRAEAPEQAPPPSTPPRASDPPAMNDSARAPSATAAAPTHGASVSVGAGIASGITAPLAPIFMLDVSLYGTRLRAIAGAMLAPAITHELAPGRVRQALRSASLAACLAPFHNGALRLDLCGTASLAFVHARAEGFDVNEEATRALPALGFGLRFGRMPAALGVELSAELLVPLRRQDFAVDNAGVAYASSPLALLIALRAGAGLAW